MKRVLLVTDGFIHPPLAARKVLHKTLSELDGFEFQHTRSMGKLPNDLNGFSALVLYFHHKKMSDGVLEAFDGFVSNGGGVLGVHSATASFKKQMHYFEILGGRFTGHGPVENFEVKPVSESNIFTGIPAFTVGDELYIHDLQPGNDVHFTANHEGQDVPAVWTRQYGKGRVCYTVPGHTAASMQNRTYQKILQRGLIWVCGE